MPDERIRVHFNGHTIRNLPYDENLTISETIAKLGYTSIRYHPEAENWDGNWSMDRNEYLMLVLKYG